VALVGVGKAGKTSLENLRQAAGTAARCLQEARIESAAFVLPTPTQFQWLTEANPAPEALAQCVTEGARLALFRFSRSSKVASEPPTALSRLSILTDSGIEADVLRGCDQAEALCESIDQARELVIRPGNDVTPAVFAEEALTLEALPWADPLSVQRQLKRAADIAVSLLLLLVTLPLMLLAALLIWIEDHGPVLFVQDRSGLMGKTFRLYKLRTMRHSPQCQPTPWTSLADSRITRIGQFLRRTRLDEIPQLINVIRGEMSLIGPRPEQPHIDRELAERIPHYHKRYGMPPGLSGWAQVCGPAYPATFEEAELKLSYDLFYLRHWNVFLDALIFAKTLKTVLKVKGR
jgi:lipopolysaccharide/colanic/teichoic acid biosynthesis glycosyltransferase